GHGRGVAAGLPLLAADASREAAGDGQADPGAVRPARPRGAAEVRPGPGDAGDRAGGPADGRVGLEPELTAAAPGAVPGGFKRRPDALGLSDPRAVAGPGADPSPAAPPVGARPAPPSPAPAADAVLVRDLAERRGDHLAQRERARAADHAEPDQ